MHFSVLFLHLVLNLVSSQLLLNTSDMVAKDKLRERFMRLPKDFTFDEMVRLLRGFGYILDNKGATSGSRARFKNEITNEYIDIHRPHPGNIMKEWMMKTIFNHLKTNGLI